jgi:HEAT repeat protein
MIRWLSRSLLLLVLLAGSLRADETPVQLFKKYYGTYKDSASRVEAILSLEGVDDPAVVEVLTPKLKEKDTDLEITNAIVRILSGLKAQPQIDALLAALKTDKTEAVRVVALRAIATGKYAGTQAAVTACLADKAWEVKRRAIQALFALGDTSQAPALVAMCADKEEPAVRCEAIETLARLGSELVVEPAIHGLTDKLWQVKTSSVFALGHVRSAHSIEPLIAQLAIPENGRLLPEIAEALSNLTGQENGLDAAVWQQWWNANKANYVLPTEQGIAYMREKRVARTGDGKNVDYGKTGVVEYNGIQTLSRSILFVIDVSGSMEAMVTEKERFEAGGYASLSRMEICKTELARTIDRLEPYVNFNVLAFATDIDPWKQKLVQANILNKSAAKAWVSRLEPIGGSSKEDLAMMGLAGSASLDKGKTNTYGALTQALNVNSGPRTGDKSYLTDVDTIFFLSDGRPTVGTFVDTDDILREIKAANELRKVVIHTIAIGEFEKTFMRRMAEQNGGVFVDLGK